MEASYKQNEMDAFGIAVRLEQMLKKEQSDHAEDWKSQLKQIEQQIQVKKFRVAVVGEFNRGKSSFINVLLGKKILPEDVVATTAAINRVTYGEKPKAYLVMKEGGRKSGDIPVEELTSYVTKLTEDSAKAAAGIDEAVVEYPTMLCYNGVDLIDTPGMNDMDDMNAVTVNRLEDIDLAIVAINGMYPYSKTENRFVVKLLESKKICQIIFVITHFDMIRDREKKKLLDFLYTRIPGHVLEEIRKTYPEENEIYRKYHTVFDNLHIYGLSSVMGMEALETNNMELYQESGFMKLSRELPEVILSSKSVNMIDNIVRQLEGIIREYKKEINGGKDTWKKWCGIKVSCERMIAVCLNELHESAEQEITSENIQREADKLKRIIVERLLNALGGISEMTYESVQQAMLPVMKKLFQRVNIGLKELQNLVLERIVNHGWSSSLSYLVYNINETVKNDPKLQKMLQPETEKLGQLPQLQFEKQEEFVFGWQQSPIWAVVSVKKGQSVLPALREIAGKSIDASLVQITANLRREEQKMLAEIKKPLKSYVDDAIDMCIKQQRNQNVDMELLKEMDSLQSECAELHKRICKKT